MKKIALSRQGKNKDKYFTLVDDEDYEWLSQWRWYYSNKNKYTGYAVRGVWNKELKRNKRIWIHREILKPPEGLYCDHINGNGLDNRKKNLRTCTSAENQKNRSMSENNTSGFKGVAWHKPSKKWLVSATFNGKRRHLGRYKSKMEAAKVYDEFAKKYHGEFAKFNFPKNR